MSPFQSEVIHGDGRGRELGFPTANLLAGDGDDIPDDGVFGGIAELEDGSRHVAAISVGRRPHFYSSDGDRLVEAHLLGFSGDLYGQQLKVEFGERVRSQMVFASESELIAQIQIDVAQVDSMSRCEHP